jgi:hypothetical protein
MAPDAGTPSRHESRRKTLDDIRREIEAEYCPPALSDDPVDPAPAARTARKIDEHADLDDELLLRRLTAPEHASDWRGYVMAGVIGCIAGQLIILGYVALARYGGDLSKLRESFSMPRLSAPLMRTDDTVVSASVRRETVTTPGARSPAEPLVPAGPGSPTGADAATAPEKAPASGAVSDRDAASSAPVAAVPAPGTDSSRVAATPPPAVPAAPPPPLPAAPAVGVTPAPAPAAPARRAREERNEGSPRPAVVRQAPPRVAPAPETSRSLPGPDNWVESQAQLRAALGEWLTLWERGGTAEVSEAEVVLGADGRTAKTLVPTRSGNRIVFREQRWERGPRGWNIVAEREVAPPGR